MSIERNHDESATKFIACFTVQSFVHAKSPTLSVYHLEHRVGSKNLGRGPTEHEERVVDTGPVVRALQKRVREEQVSVGLGHLQVQNAGRTPSHIGWVTTQPFGPSRSRPLFIRGSDTI